MASLGSLFTKNNNNNNNLRKQKINNEQKYIFCVFLFSLRSLFFFFLLSNVIYVLVLFVIPSFDEVKILVFDMDHSSAPKLDGYTNMFVGLAWDIIGEEVCEAVCFFFLTSSIPSGLNSNFNLNS